MVKINRKEKGIAVFKMQPHQLAFLEFNLSEGSCGYFSQTQIAAGEAAFGKGEP